MKLLFISRMSFEIEGKIIVPRFALSSNFRLFENYFLKFISFQSFKEFWGRGVGGKIPWWRICHVWTTLHEILVAMDHREAEGGFHL